MRASQLRQSPLFFILRPIYIINKPARLNASFRRVPLAGIEPTRLLRPQDFKSCVYTNFTTAAYFFKEWHYYNAKTLI
jgi:hypothetical protein